MKDLEVIEPCLEYLERFIEMSQDYRNNEEDNYIFSSKEDAANRIKNDIDRRNGVVNNELQQYSFWFMITGRIVGTSRLRPILNERFKRKGGNIGYDVRPSYRKMGIGTTILKMTIEKARMIGLKEILITCSDENVGSIKIIEKNSGELIDKIFWEEECKMYRRYHIQL
jgi:predicted acetyltransferase